MIRHVCWWVKSIISLLFYHWQREKILPLLLERFWHMLLRVVFDKSRLMAPFMLFIWIRKFIPNCQCSCRIRDIGTQRPNIFFLINCNVAQFDFVLTMHWLGSIGVRWSWWWWFFPASRPPPCFFWEGEGSLSPLPPIITPLTAWWHNTWILVCVYIFGKQHGLLVALVAWCIRLANTILESFTDIYRTFSCGDIIVK